MVPAGATLDVMLFEEKEKKPERKLKLSSKGEDEAYDFRSR